MLVALRGQESIVIIIMHVPYCCSHAIIQSSAQTYTISTIKLCMEKPENMKKRKEEKDNKIKKGKERERKQKIK